MEVLISSSESCSDLNSKECISLSANVFTQQQTSQDKKYCHHQTEFIGKKTGQVYMKQKNQLVMTERWTATTTVGLHFSL
jgi:hypothetical protein